MKTLREVVGSLAAPANLLVSLRVVAQAFPAPVSLRAALNGKIIFNLNLEQLRCVTTESDLGSDHCRLEIYTDGALEFSLRDNLNNNETWNLSRTYGFEKNVVVKLWDENKIDSDDHLGTIVISGAVTNQVLVKFNKAGSEYILQYRVTPHLAPAIFDFVQEEIKLFEKSAVPGTWAKIAKNELIADLKTTVGNAFNVNQANTPLCGPAAIIFELARRQPKRYVQICRRLWENGEFPARRQNVAPSKDLLNSPVKENIKNAKNVMSLAD